ncbi:MAG: PQQ-dependent sugar dehydrogenase [Gemmatimonadota bacterium]|nr:PQQ-dependent sugar dehydrogenase [Gemmatimonadota bacterium]
MFRTRQAFLAACLGLVCALPTAAQDIMRSAYHDYRVVTVADGLEHPWSIAFLPDGDILVTERPGRLRIIRDGRLLPDAVEGVPEVVAVGQGGLLDVVPHPDFASNRLLYISYSKPLADQERGTTAVIRGRFADDRLTDVEEIFEARSEGNGHYGSRLAFHPDGHLFITVGDRQAPPRGDLEAHPAQDVSNHHGTVNRVNDDGSIPSDNPFVDDPNAQPEIYSYGHRNPQGLVIDPATGDIWATEHGPQGGDELNRILPGVNYGWPVVGYGVNYGSGEAIHGATMREGMQNPTHFWVPSIATSGLLLYTGDAFPEWRGNLFVGGMAGEQLARLTLERGGDGEDEDGVTVAEETLVRGIGRIRDVRQGPDGFIYLAIDNRRAGLTPIVRLEPVADR